MTTFIFPFHIVREEFGRGNDFATKVTYTVQDLDSIIKQFRSSAMPRIVVSVGMIAGGVLHAKRWDAPVGAGPMVRTASEPGGVPDRSPVQ